jgi:hypothetical protein
MKSHPRNPKWLFSCAFATSGRGEIKFPFYTMRAYGGMEVQLQSFLTTPLEMSGQLHAPAALSLAANE